MTGKVKIRFKSFSRAEFLAGSARKDLVKAAEMIPINLVMKSPFYSIELKGANEPGAATADLPIPNDSEPLRTLDVYRLERLRVGVAAQPRAAG